MLTDLKVGRVGDCVPPPGLVADLKSFDPSLRMLWNRDEQCWTVVQRVRRSRVVGEMDDGAIREVHDVDRPVLYLSDLTGDPDRRIIAQLFRQRLAGKKQRLERAKRRISEAKAAQEKERSERFEPARERLEGAAHDLRKSGFGGTVAPVYVPRGVEAA